MTKKTEKNTSERRYFTGAVEYRAVQDGENESRIIEGYACRFGERSELLWGQFYEIIDAGAFDGVDLSSVVCRGNHDNNELLGRTENNTLTLEVRKDGFFYSCDVAPTTTGNDWLALIKRADVNKSSFAFIVKEDEWRTLEDGKEERTIKKFEIVTDVAPVTRPAYGGSSVEKRDVVSALNSLEEWRKSNNPNYKDKRAEELRIGQNTVLFYKQAFS